MEAEQATIDPPHPLLEDSRRVGTRKGKTWLLLLHWLWQRPFLWVLLAHTVFSIGIWNARDGYVEETNNVVDAFHILKSHRPGISIYDDLIALTLRLTPDPVVALTLLKYLSSLLSTFALYLALRSFSKYLRPGAIVFACFAWIASPLHAPLLVSTSLSLFTFAIMLLGIDCLLLRTYLGGRRGDEALTFFPPGRKHFLWWCCQVGSALSQSVKGLFGFYFFGLMAALLRPEYFLPLALMTLFLMGRAVWSTAKHLKSRRGWPRRWICAGAFCLALIAGAVLWAKLPAPLSVGINHLDKYALLGLGQCYADFHHKEHPQEVFDPMTEYKAILNREFNHPSGFAAAVRNNPWEALRYFMLNTKDNLLHNVPNALVSHARILSDVQYRRFPFQIVRVVVIVGALLGALRFYRFSTYLGSRRGNEALTFLPLERKHFPWRRCQVGSALSRNRRNYSVAPMLALFGRSPLGRKLLLLLLLLSTSSVAIVLLVGSPRYFFCWTPLFYLEVAYCADSLLRLSGKLLTETLFVALFFILLCSPNYLAPRPNYEFNAVRQVACLVKEYPTVGAWWAEPDTVLALEGKGRAISIWDGIYQADIENGKFDILMLDLNFRSSKTWSDQRDFFEKVERQPETFGFKKVTGIPTGRFDIYYKYPPRRETK